MHAYIYNGTLIRCVLLVVSLIFHSYNALSFVLALHARLPNMMMMHDCAGSGVVV